jgi:hypothetical protein
MRRQSAFDIAGGVGAGFEAFGEIEKIANDPPSLDEQEHRIGPGAAVRGRAGRLGRDRRRARRSVQG